jgi:hypothetical protein
VPTAVITAGLRVSERSVWRRRQVWQADSEGLAYREQAMRCQHALLPRPQGRDEGVHLDRIRNPPIAAHQNPPGRGSPYESGTTFTVYLGAELRAVTENSVTGDDDMLAVVGSPCHNLVECPPRRTHAYHCHVRKRSKRVPFK